MSETEKAIELHAALDKIDLATVPVLSTDRCLPRKEAAALARKLFRSLKLNGISVTAPNYSMCFHCEVRLPKRDDYPTLHKDEWGFDKVDFANDPVSAENQKARTKVRQILALAFPNHDDRSDSMTDYFDAKWTVE